MWGAERPPGGDAAFTAAISRRMQVPPRLRLLGGSEGPGATEPEAPPAAAFQMHLPDRLCLAEMVDVASRPLFGGSPEVDDAPLDLAVRAAVLGGQPCLAFVSPSGAQKRKRPEEAGQLRNPSSSSSSTWPSPLDKAEQRRSIVPVHPSSSSSSSSSSTQPSPQEKARSQAMEEPCRGHHSRARKDRGGSPMDGPHLAMEVSAWQRQDCSREMTLILESSLEEFGPTDMLALRKQLMRISGRLQALEEQSMGWRQKQLLFYSILVSACILNLWLWLRR